MNRREYDFTFDGEPIFEIIRRTAPPRAQEGTDEFFVFVMGPYTAFDATQVFSDADDLLSPFIDDPLFDPARHVRPDGKGSYRKALKELCRSLMEDLDRVRAFIASDIDIPTETAAGGSEPSMTVLDQSIAFAAVSDAVIFIFTEGGLTTGTGAEAGAILADFNLRIGNLEPIRKPHERFRIFQHEGFSSATIDELPSTFGIDTVTFQTREELIKKIQHFLANIERVDSDRVLPIYTPYEL